MNGNDKARCGCCQRSARTRRLRGHLRNGQTGAVQWLVKAGEGLLLIARNSTNAGRSATRISSGAFELRNPAGRSEDRASSAASDNVHRLRPAPRRCARTRRIPPASRGRGARPVSSKRRVQRMKSVHAPGSISSERADRLSSERRTRRSHPERLQTESLRSRRAVEPLRERFQYAAHGLVESGWSRSLAAPCRRPSPPGCRSTCRHGALPLPARCERMTCSSRHQRHRHAAADDLAVGDDVGLDVR